MRSTLLVAFAAALASAAAFMPAGAAIRPAGAARAAPRVSAPRRCLPLARRLPQNSRAGAHAHAPAEGAEGPAPRACADAILALSCWRMCVLLPVPSAGLRSANRGNVLLCRVSTPGPRHAPFHALGMYCGVGPRENRPWVALARCVLR
jgi:hypothetical protein